MKTIYRLLTQLSSRKIISKTAGKAAKAKWSRRLIPHFARVYQIDMDETEKEQHEYPSLNAFFTRRLKEGCRIIHPAEDTVISPVDGRITAFGAIEEGSFFHVKGQRYSLAELLADEHKVRTYRHGQYIVIYLSPADYHRIHAPVSGHILGHAPHPGTVFPVNPFGMMHIKKVLSRNQRLITYIQNEHTEVAVVKVGALNVASIQLSDRLTSREVRKGDELAYFEFGSTVVLLVEKHAFQFHEHLQEGQRVKMGEAIGRLTDQ